MSKLPQLYLASHSPRRHELLTQLGVSFATLTIDLPEVRNLHEAPADFVVRMAQEKASMGWSNQQHILELPVLAADTIVVIDGDVLGKPRDRAAGLMMLQRLAGRSHQVLSAVALQLGERKASLLSTSTVHFRALTINEINYYWETGEPCDKAGAYAIQGLAAAFITYLEGSYSGVMGLPLYETAQLLDEFGMAILR